MGEIKDLYNNAASYAEGFGYPNNPEWHRLTLELMEATEELSKELNDKQKPRLEEIKELYLQSYGLELDRMFVYGFKCGARLIMDVSTE